MEEKSFVWKGGYERVIHHPSSQLPELPLVCDSTNNAFCSYIEQHESAVDDSVQFAHSSCYSCSDVSSQNTTTLSGSDEDVTISAFEIGERLFYTND
jgi:hypothetical protein